MRAGLLAVLLALAAPPRGAAAEVLRCVSLEYPPLIQKDADGRAHGLAVDIVGAVLRRMGHALSVEVLPWGRSLALARLGERDCVFTIFHSPERAQFLDFSRESIIPQIIYFYARRDGAVAFDGNLRALGARTVGTVLMVNYGAKFEAARPALQVQEVATLEQNFRKLALGRIDLTPSNLYTASYTLGLLGASGVAARIVQLPQPIDSVPSFIAFAKRRHLTALRDQFDVELRAFVASGAYRRLLEQYRIEVTPELARFLAPR
ncbi:substrate-binding periplasmic protein [Janthinobacterium fluminis]|uniref:Transporter substrate-binding domain-containing protein n=1 Tax=Janthinobacterium fluminis TaxID=2987524 RepID=A0ABT5JTQ0_9BURK|nr:transporter substrate-binding domain-containing protein [Janthinobacterium fluminis]MDC8756128.1 transporter substrate-binding domain-containing protein [Janthinobacterium fluminis]